MGGGRKFGEAYELYEFYPKVVDRKYVAVCRYCSKQMQNTSGSRLRKHRTVCKVSTKIGSNGELPTSSRAGTIAPELLTSAPKVDVSKLKTEIEEPLSRVASPMENQNYIPPSPDPIDENLYEKQIEYIQDYLSDNPLSHDNVDADRTGTSAAGETPRATASARKRQYLEEQKTRAEIQYLRTKTAYFTYQLKNLTMERSLMTLKSEKLQLEIKKLRNTNDVSVSNSQN